MRFSGREQGLQGSRHQFADRCSGRERTLSQALDQAARKTHGQDILAVGDGNGCGELLGLAQVAVGLASRDGEFAGEAFDGVRQVRAFLQQRAGEIEPVGFLGVADPSHMTYNIYSTCLMSSLVIEVANALKRKVTFCVGGVISPLIANLFLHYVLDRWFVETVQPRLRGASQLVRFADDFVMTFADAGDGQRVLAVLGKRLGRFGLTLNATKTHYVDFRPPRCAGGHEPPASFDFLGFTHTWGRSRRGFWVVRQITSKQRFARGLRAVTNWCKRHRHAPLTDQQKRLASMIRGHCNYYGLTGNGKRLGQFRHEVVRTWQKWLSRRSRQRRVNWERMTEVLERYPLPPAKVVHSIYTT